MQTDGRTVDVEGVRGAGSGRRCARVLVEKPGLDGRHKLDWDWTRIGKEPPKLSLQTQDPQDPSQVVLFDKQSVVHVTLPFSQPLSFSGPPPSHHVDPQSKPATASFAPDRPLPAGPMASGCVHGRSTGTHCGHSELESLHTRSFATSGGRLTPHVCILCWVSGASSHCPSKSNLATAKRCSPPQWTTEEYQCNHVRFGVDRPAPRPSLPPPGNTAAHRLRHVHAAQQLALAPASGKNAVHARRDPPPTPTQLSRATPKC